MAAIPGNLFPYNDESFETSVAGWGGGTGTNTLAQSTLEAKEATHSCLVTSLSDTNANYSMVYNNTKIPVTALRTYNFAAWVWPTAAGQTCNLEIDWYVTTTFNNFADLLNNSNNTGGLVALTQNAWNYVCLTATAPATVNAAVPLVIVSKALSTVQTFYADELYIGPTLPGPLGPMEVNNALAPHRSTMVTASTR